MGSWRCCGQGLSGTNSPTRACRHLSNVRRRFPTVLHRAFPYHQACSHPPSVPKCVAQSVRKLEHDRGSLLGCQPGQKALQCAHRNFELLIAYLMQDAQTVAIETAKKPVTSDMPTSVKFPDIAFKFALSRRMNTQSPLNSLLIDIDELTAQPASIYEGGDPLEVNMHGLDKVGDRTFKKFVDLQPHQKLKTRATQAQWMMLRRFLYRWLERTFHACLQSMAKDHGRSTEGFIDSSDLLKCLPFTAASQCLREPPPGSGNPASSVSSGGAEAEVKVMICLWLRLRRKRKPLVVVESTKSRCHVVPSFLVSSPAAASSSHQCLRQCHLAQGACNCHGGRAEKQWALPCTAACALSEGGSARSMARSCPCRDSLSRGTTVWES